MKPFLFDIIKEIIGNSKPANIGEIGTHRGSTAKQLINTYSPLVENFTYTGYDVFDYAVNNVEFNKSERNGKNGAQYDKVFNSLERIKRKSKHNIEIILHKGFTTETLTSPQIFDFVYIDGGHSYDTVKHDYSMVKDSKLIVFDDFKIAGVNKFVKELMEQGVDIEIVKTPTKHIWAVIRN